MVNGRARHCQCLIERKISAALPKRYQHARLSDFNRRITDAVAEWLKNPTDGLFAGGPAGTGKTHLCAGILRARYESWQNARFVRAAELYMEVRNCYKSDDVNEQALLARFTDSPLLILDDLGAGSLSDHERRIALEILDRRLNDVRPTVVTSNWTIEEIGSKMDERIASRLSSFKVIGFTGKDRRQAQSIAGKVPIESSQPLESREVGSN